MYRSFRSFWTTQVRVTTIPYKHESANRLHAGFSLLPLVRHRLDVTQPVQELKQDHVGSARVRSTAQL